MAGKDPITCHVLDTTTGRPAVNMAVTLSCSTVEDFQYEAKTDDDGRITKWEVPRDLVGISEMIEQQMDTGMNPPGITVWQLTFDTGGYYGYDKTFWPTVQISFMVKEGEHYHVPLLLGPYSYTTYRGS